MTREDAIMIARRTDRAQLIVRNLGEDVVEALKARAAAHGRSAEAEHRAILDSALHLSWATIP